MRVRTLPWLILVALLAGCVTVNVYFPEGEIRDLSRQIEEEIRLQAAEEAAAAESEAEPDEPQAALARPPHALRLAAAALLGAPVYAQNRVPPPEVSNPAIRSLIDARAARLAQLNRLKAQGVVGESNQALVEARSLEAISDLRQRAAAQRLIRDENADREQLFKEIARATGVDPAQIPRIRQTYAATLREESRPGDWIQMPDGSWRQK